MHSEHTDSLVTVQQWTEETSAAENQAVYESSARDYEMWLKRVLRSNPDRADERQK